MSGQLLGEATWGWDHRVAPDSSLLGDSEGFPGCSVVKNPPAKQELQERQVHSLSGEGTLEEGIETHPGASAWRIPWREEAGRLQTMGWQRVRHD